MQQIVPHSGNPGMEKFHLQADFLQCLLHLVKRIIPFRLEKQVRGLLT